MFNFLRNIQMSEEAWGSLQMMGGLFVALLLVAAMSIGCGGQVPTAPSSVKAVLDRRSDDMSSVIDGVNSYLYRLSLKNGEKDVILDAVSVEYLKDDSYRVTNETVEATANIEIMDRFFRRGVNHDFYPMNPLVVSAYTQVPISLSGTTHGVGNIVIQVIVWLKDPVTGEKWVLITPWKNIEVQS